MTLAPNTLRRCCCGLCDFACRFVTLLIACFNIFDCVGRMLLSLPVLIPRRNPKRWLVVLMLMRLIFFPLFFWRALPSMGNNSDAFAFIVVALFSASNGFVGTLAMQEGPQHCKFAPLPLPPLRPLAPSSRQKRFPAPLSTPHANLFQGKRPRISRDSARILPHGKKCFMSLYEAQSIETCGRGRWGSTPAHKLATR